MHRILRWWWQFQAYFGKQEPEEFRLFILFPKLDILEFRKRLIPLGYQENLFGITYKGMIYQCRSLDPDGIHIFHVRYFEDGKVTGHWEVDYYVDVISHNQSKDLRPLTKNETAKIQWDLNRRAL